MISKQVEAAIIRSLDVAMVAGTTAELASYHASHNVREALLTGLGVFLLVLFRRGLVEGGYDTWRQVNGVVRPADVQHPPGVVQ